MGNLGNMQSEERRSVRHSLSARIRITYHRQGQQQQIFGSAGDVSEGGIALFVPADLCLGSRLSLEFSLPGRLTPLLLQALVRHRQGFRYGLEFAPLNKAQQRDILQWCEVRALTREDAELV